MRVSPLDDYRTEFKEYMDHGAPAVLPVEFYDVDWRDFADAKLSRRPRELATSYIDSRTIRSTAGVDYHTRRNAQRAPSAVSRKRLYSVRPFR